MRVNSRKVIQLIEEFAPVSLAEEWDSVGFQVGNIDAAVDKVMVALDVTEAVVREAEEKSADLLVVHHPLIFKPTASLTEQTALGRILRQLVRNNMHVYVAHTNLDSALNGLNDFLAGELQLDRTEPLRVMERGFEAEVFSGKEGSGRIGYLNEVVTVQQMALRMKEILGSQTIRICGDPAKKIRKAAICTGAGSDLIGEAHHAGCDILITGDVKYHEARVAEELGIALIDGGHFETEAIYMPRFASWLRNRIDEKDYSVSVVVSESLKSPFSAV